MCAHKDSLRAQTHSQPAAPQGGPCRRDTNITAKCARGPHYWKEAMKQFAILYAERFIRLAA